MITMRSRRTAYRFAFGAAVAALATLTSISPANAAATITDNGDGSFTVSGVPSAGGTNYLYFCSSSTSAAACWNNANPVATLAVADPAANGTFTAGSTVRTFPGGLATTLSAGTYRVITNSGASLDATALVTVFAGGGSSGGSGNTPAAILQEFGQPSSGTCDSAQPAGLNWAGVAAGGWRLAWGEWLNERRGGWACSRVIAFDPSSGVWGVR
jgi:hypothetical protein